MILELLAPEIPVSREVGVLGKGPGLSSGSGVQEMIGSQVPGKGCVCSLVIWAVWTTAH